MIDQKVLVVDVETAPLTAYVWGLKDQNISLSQIKEDWYLMAWAAKWLNEPASTMLYMDKRRDSTDERIVRSLWKLLDEADILITQNGKAFDGPKLNARFIHYGMKPPSPYKHLDTYLIARGTAQFTSNKLEYLTDKLCTKYKKLSHAKFPGMSLWVECLKGNKKAWDEMKTYNIHDVLSTEELYNKLRVWAPDNAPRVHTQNGKCGICGNASLQKRGSIVKRLGHYQRLHCQTCGRWTTGGKLK